MKVLHVTHSFFPYSYGGREKMVLEWSRCLRDKNNEVFIVTSSDSFYKFERKIIDGIEVYYLPTLKIDLISSVYRIPFFLFQFLLKRDFDICHVHDIHHFTTLLSVIVCRIKKKPVVLSYHGFYPDCGLVYVISRIYEILFLKFIKNSLVKVVVPLEFSREEIIRKFGVSEKKVVVIPNFISFPLKTKDISFKKIHNLSKYMLTIARFSKEKGFEYLLNALRIVFKKYKKIKMVLIGGNRRYLKIISSLIKNLDLENRLIIVNNASDEEIYSAIKECELFILPSIYEPFGIVILEAMYFGKPVIAFNRGGPKELIKNGFNGLLVGLNSKSLADAIFRLLEDKKTAKLISKNSLNFVKRYDRRNFVEFVNKFYRKILINKAYK